MKGKYISAMVAGSILGAAAGMYSSNMMKSKSRRKLIKMGRKIIRM